MPKRDVTTNHRDGLWSDVEERGYVLQVEVLNNARTTSQQHLITLMRCGAVKIMVTSFVLTEDVLTDFKKVKKHLEKYQLHEFSQLNDAIARLFEANKVSALDHDTVNKNFKAYHDFLLEKNHEAYAHFVSLLDGTTYKQMLIWLSKELPDTYKKVITFIRQL